MLSKDNQIEHRAEIQTLAAAKCIHIADNWCTAQYQDVISYTMLSSRLEQLGDLEFRHLDVHSLAELKRKEKPKNKFVQSSLKYF